MLLIIDRTEYYKSKYIKLNNLTQATEVNNILVHAIDYWYSVGQIIMN